MNKRLSACSLFLLLVFVFFKAIVFGQCQADAGPNITICLGEAEQIGDVPAGNGAGPLIYSWSPATNLSCTDCPNPICTATTNTTYTLTITDTNGCTDSDNVNVTVFSYPVAGFTFSPNNSCANVPIQFTNTSTGTNLNYSWNFGNPASGNSNTTGQTNPSHEFEATGSGSETFNVTLIVTGQGGCKDTIVQQVTVSQTIGAELIDPLTNFKNCDGSNFDMTVYDNSATSGNTNYTIVWGDGSPNFNSATFPGAGVNHLYNTSDIFDLLFIVTGTNGCIDTSLHLVSNITNPAIGAANPGATTGCGPITLCFPLSNYSTNHSSTFYVVDYGDGSPVDTLPHPPPATLCHTYSETSCGEPGNAFTFIMKAINSCDSSLASISPIRVYSAPVADFTPNMLIACVNTPITFMNQSVLGFNSSCSNSTIFNWDFGDGTTLTTFTMTSPSHPYALPGTYTVTLSAQNACGTTTHQETVCIEVPPVPNFILSEDTACVPFNAQVTNLSTTANTCDVTYLWQVFFNGSTCLPSAGTWDFINGTDANSINPEFQFSGAGQYTVRLTMVNSCGTFIYNQVVIGQSVPQLTLTGLPAICAGESVSPTVTVNNCYEPVDSYTWSFPGGLPVSSAVEIPGSVQYINAGNYTIELQASNLCGTTLATTPVVVNAPPIANAGPDVEFCSSGNSPLGSALVGGVSYSWNPATGLNSGFISNPTVTLTNATPSPIINEYVLTAFTSATCFTTDTVLVTVNPIPALLVNSPIICFGETTTLNISGADPGGTYNWIASPSLSCTNCDNPNANPTITTTYSVSGTNVYGCQSSINSTVTVNPLPLVDAGPDQQLCDQPIPVTFVGSPAGGTWSGSPNLLGDGTFTPNGLETSTVYYSYTDPGTTCQNLDSMVVTVNSLVIPVIDPIDSLCMNQAPVDLLILLNANPTGGVFSGTGVSGSNFDPGFAGLGTHEIVYTLGTGSCNSADTAYITVNEQPVISVNSETICFGDTVALLADGAGPGGTYSWTPVTELSCSNCPNPFAFPINTVNHTIVGTNIFGCSATAVSTVTVNPLPVVDAGSDLILCDQPVSTTLNGSPAGGIWTGSVNVTAGGVFTPNGTENSTLIYTYVDPVTSCENMDSMVISVSPPIVPTVDPTFVICENAPIVNLTVALNATPAGGIWSGVGVINPDFNPSTSGVGTFTVSYTYGSGTCETIVTSDITVNPQPTISVNSETICNGQSIQLLATGAGIGGNYEWSPATDLSCTSCEDPIANPSATITYTVTGTNSFACSNSATSTVTVSSLPIVDAGSDLLLCDQPIPSTLNGTPAGGVWSGSPNVTGGGTFTPNGTEVSTLYYLFMDAVSGCENIDSMVVTVNPPIVPTLDPTYSICENEAAVNLSTVLNVNPLGGTWSGTGVTDPNFSPGTSGLGTFTVSYTYGVGTCQTVVNSDITVNPQPVISANNETICDGQSIILNASGAGIGGNYEWSPATDLSCTACQSTTANPSTSIVYSVTGTTSFGCVNSTTSSVTVNPLPIANAGPDTVLCNLPAPVQFIGIESGGVWSGPEITSGGLFTPNGTGTFTVTYTVTLGTGCINSDSRDVQVVDPTPANAGLDLEECINNPDVSVIGTPAGGTWTGTNTTVSGIFSPISAGIYPLVYTVGSGNCLTRDTMEFTVHALPIVDAGNDQDFCATDAAINFVGVPAGGFWSGNGITNAATGTFDPATAGVGLHSIVYTYTNPITSCLNTDTLLADVHPLPLVGFTFNPIVCVGTSETFTNTSTLVNSSSWDFGDGSSSAQLSPDHIYTSIGFYPVNLIVSTAFGCMDSLSQTVEVREPPVADFAVLPDSACGPMTVSFTNNSSGIGLSYDWNFGNGQVSSDEDPAPETYLPSVIADTSYTVVLNVTNFCGTVTHTEDVIVMPGPTAIFGSDFNTFCSPFTANFASTSLGLPDSYFWDFGNGVTSSTTDSLFQQTFTTDSVATDYTIMLVVYNECGVDTAYHTITVVPNNVNAFFNTSATTSCNDLTVNFTQYTLGGTLWSWDFGDGTSSSEYSPSHVYPSPGTYDVSLFANDGCSFDTTTVTIVVNEPPLVAFSVSPDSVCINSPFNFINESIGSISSYWNFGDGTTSSVTNPSHSYAAMGDYIVTLTGTSLINGCSSTVTQTVHVSVNPVAQFIAVPTNGCVPLTVQFTNQSSGATFNTWDFGDGNTSAQVNPSHTFNAVGVYTVELEIENANGCMDVYSQNITVHPLPVAGFTSVYNCMSPVTVDLTNQSTGAINYDWDFGNGQTSVLTNPTATYPVPGNYTITLEVTNQYGCLDVFQQNITVYPTPNVSFNLPVLQSCAMADLEFIAQSSFVDSLVWNMGDGTILTGDTVYYAYPNPGAYYVTVTAYGGGGCIVTASSSTSIIINPNAIANFEYENIQVNEQANGTVSFTNLSEFANIYWWEFGDGSTSSDLNPTHDFGGLGNFYTTLYADNQYGCNDSVTVEVVIDFFSGLFLPNAIYPGHSSFEVSHFVPKGVGLKEFELLIYDDWGNLIWQTTAIDANGRPTESWDGTFNGEPVQQDAYVWKVTAVFLDESVWEGKEYNKGRIKKSGTVTVIR